MICVVELIVSLLQQLLVYDSARWRLAFFSSAFIPFDLAATLVFSSLPLDGGLYSGVAFLSQFSSICASTHHSLNPTRPPQLYELPSRDPGFWHYVIHHARSSCIRTQPHPGVWRQYGLGFCLCVITREHRCVQVTVFSKE